MRGENLLFALPLLAGGVAQAKESQPNIIFIVVDDLGYSDVGYMGQKSVPTPNIDELAKRSINFTNSYSAAPVSSPTRASLVTGLTPAQVKLTCHIPGVGIERYNEKMNAGHTIGEAHFGDHIDPATETIAKMMQRSGYSTAFIGKWHLAGEGSIYTDSGVINPEWQPDNYGYEINIGGCSYGQPARYFSPYKNATIEDGEDGEYLTDRLTDEAIDYITRSVEKGDGKPFYLNLSYYTVHTPYQVPEAIIEANGGDKYMAMINKLDDNIGRIVAAIEELGIAENSVVVFTSDNGGVQNNPPLSGKKGDILEGGIRIPLLVSWPAVIKTPSVCETPTSTIDFYRTLSHIASMGEREEVVECDSRSLYPILVDGDSSTFEDRSIFWHFPHRRAGTQWSMAAAVRKGEWKLIYLFESDEYLLFNLDSDIKESKNVIRDNRKVAAQLKAELSDYWQRVDAQMPVKLEE